jgi:DNA helicase HerA-like ATPase
VSRHPVPDQALAHHIAVLGKTGSGKSNAVKVLVEEGLDAGERTCVIDPTGAWWGLRLKADGKPSKYPVVIFGGLHADVQIGRRHGQAVAEVVATSSTPAVIDTRLMTVGERTAFFTAFAQTLLRRNRGPLRLVVDEAHLFAPQSRVADPRRARCSTPPTTWSASAAASASGSC